MLVGGGALLRRPSTWGRYTQALGVHVHGGPSFTLSFAAVAGGVAVVIGPVVIAVGQWLVNRTTTTVRNDPVLSTILTEPED